MSRFLRKSQPTLWVASFSQAAAILTLNVLLRVAAS